MCVIFWKADEKLVNMVNLINGQLGKPTEMVKMK